MVRASNFARNGNKNDGNYTENYKSSLSLNDGTYKIR